MRSKHKPEKKPKIIKITPEQQEKLTAAIKASNLDAALGEFVIGLMWGNRWLVDALEKGRLSIAKLRKLFNMTTEKALKRKNSANNNKGNNAGFTVNNPDNTVEGDDQNNLNPLVLKGHGRKSADAYTGAVVIDVKLADLKPGDECPQDYCDGRLYEMSDPGVMIQITGGVMAQATRYNLQKLRCAICEIVFTAPLPAGVENKKYTDSFVTMLMVNKYFMSVPLYRQEALQNYLGVPLPSSTQWELMAEHEDVFAALYSAFEFDAAQGKGMAIDDTKARILEQIAINKKASKKADKKSCYTTGLVSVHDDHMSYIFVTDNQTAGKSAAPFLRLRNPDLPTPYVMCDALTANIPEDISSNLYILCYCLVHARRQFYELPDGYDDLVDTVIALIGKIYDIEDATKGMDAKSRMQHHQHHSQPIMNELRSYLTKQQQEFEPNGVAGKAIEYMLKRWTELTQFLRHPDVPLDNNITERALKLIIQARKSSMFYKTLRSAKIASYIQTALYSAAQNAINPCIYIETILKNKQAVIKNPERWLPWNYHDAARLEEGNCRHDGASNPG
jgi:transposase